MSWTWRWTMPTGPRGAHAERYVAVGQAASADLRGARADTESITSGARLEAPSPAP